MNEEDVLNKLERRTNPNSLTRKYGVFGLSLGQDLYEKLDKYCSNKDITKAGLIKFLLTDYLKDKV